MQKKQVLGNGMPSVALKSNWVKPDFGEGEGVE